MIRFRYIAGTLPKQFKSVSITGGEPNLNPNLVKVLLETIQRSARFDRIVYNTSGGHMESIISEVNRLGLGHKFCINLSRHHYDDTINNQIFHSPVDMKSYVHDVVYILGSNGISVTLNCVIPNDQKWGYGFIQDYLGYARSYGIMNVVFRKMVTPTSTLEPSFYEEQYKFYPLLGESSCPVCRSVTRKVQDMTVTFKASINEPVTVMSNLIYELIFQPNGKLTMDWRGNREVEV